MNRTLQTECTSVTDRRQTERPWMQAINGIACSDAAQKLTAGKSVRKVRVSFLEVTDVQ